MAGKTKADKRVSGELLCKIGGKLTLYGIPFARLVAKNSNIFRFLKVLCG